MDTILVEGRYRNSRILIGDKLELLPEHLPAEEVFIITDRHIYQLYGDQFPVFPVYVVEPGESGKTMNTISAICRWLMEKGATRNAFLLGIGGGIVCDITGFAASVYMRGTGFGFVATSLLAQVDAAVGGKNGVNLDGYKNMIGTFSQPHFVCCSTMMLKTLPAGELKNGLAEAVKHTLIADKKMFKRLYEDAEALLAADDPTIKRLVRHSIKIKADIVSRDEVEQGERRKLNLGHTWGHAVEKTDRIPHGQAVSIGMVFAARLSEHKGLLKPEERQEVVALLNALGLPLESLSPPEEIFRILSHDKKRMGGHVHFVLMNGIGDVVVEPMSLNELSNFARTITPLTP